MKYDTLLAQAGSRWDSRTGAVSMPIYQVTAFRHPALGQSTGFDYSRTSNPTRFVLEEVLAELEGGGRASVFSSGLAGLDAVFRLFKPGDRLVVTEDPYGGSIRLLDLYAAYGLEAVYVNTADTEAVAEVFAKGPVAGLFVEIPTNPLLRVADLKALSALAGQHGAKFIVDNTFLTSARLKPFEFGADIVVYSGTKYLAGHNDVLAGVVVSRDESTGERIAFLQNAVGATLGPLDCWLFLRGLKTLSVRLARQEENALAVARFLTGHPNVSRVFYPGLETDFGHKLLAGQASGFGGMVSFEVKSPGLVPEILKNVKVFLFAESLGGAESLITFPVVQTHGDVPVEVRARLGIGDRLLRLSLGLEDAADLIADLDSVLGASLCKTG